MIIHRTKLYNNDITTTTTTNNNNNHTHNRNTNDNIITPSHTISRI